MESQEINESTASQNEKQIPIKLENMPIQSSPLLQLFEGGLKDIYKAEKTLAKSIPKVSKNGKSKEQIHAFTKHLAKKVSQVSRVEEVFESVNKNGSTAQSEATKELNNFSSEIMGASEDVPLTDEEIVLAAQKIEQYEIESYGLLSQFPEILREGDVEAIVRKILEEEKNASQIGNQIAQTDAVKIEGFVKKEEEVQPTALTKSKRKKV